MKKIKLTQGKIAIVDDEDFERVSMFKWHTGKAGRKHCARRNIINEEGKRCMLYMHRFILDVTHVDLWVDHINGDPLDNRRSNMRICNRDQNAKNRDLNYNNSSGYKGIYWKEPNKKWEVYVARKYIGIYSSLDVAREVREKVAQKQYGIFYRKLNVK